MLSQVADTHKLLSVWQRAGTVFATVAGVVAAQLGQLRWQIEQSVAQGWQCTWFSGRYKPVGALVAAVLTTSGCIVPAPVNPVGELAQPILVIQKNRTTPVLNGATVDVTEKAYEFKADAAVKFTAAKLPLHYAWYYDLKPGTIVRHKRVSTESNCTLLACELASTKEKGLHTMMLVVSDRPLVSTETKDALNFSHGTVFDTGQWSLNLSNLVCD